MQRLQKLDALTSMRFIAAAMIVMGHAHLVFGPIGIQIPVPTGQGVSFFFVLSGFILAYNYPVLASAADIRQFWLARVARVWPLHVVTCLLWIGLIFGFDRATYFPGVGGIGRLLANIFLLQTWVPLKEWSLSFNGVSWSLSDEFFFYACFPFLIAAWKRNWHWLLLGQALVVVILVVAGHFWRLPPEDEYTGIGLLGVIYFNPLARVLEFSVGIAVAHLVRRAASAGISFSVAQWFALELAAVLGVVMSLLAAVDFAGISSTSGTSVAYYFTRQGLWLFWALLIGVCALSRGPITRLLSARIAVFLGEISYALYLCHSLIINYLMPYADQVRTYGLTGYWLYWAFCLLFSSLLFIGVETPARKLIRAWADRNKAPFSFKPAVGTGAMSALAALLVVCVSLSTLRPSFISPMSAEAAGTFLSSPGTKLDGGGAIFDGRYRILGVKQVATPDGKVEMNVMIRAEVDLVATDMLALHLNDEGGSITDKPGDVMLDKSGRQLRAGTQWIQRFSTLRDRFRHAKSIGLAMYSGSGGLSGGLFDVRGGKSDWSGKRLIINLDH